MNRRGHPETLVARQIGNRNALKAGVFSPQALAPRVHEVEAAIAERSVNDVLTNVLRREVASLAVIGEAMDESLQTTLLAIGAATVTVRAIDDGGTAGGGDDSSAAQTFTITII